MSTPASIENGPDAYGKPDRTPATVGPLTIRAVDNITTTAADSIRHAAKEVRAACELVATELEALAAACDEEGRRAREVVEQLVNRMSSVYATAISVAATARGEVPTGNTKGSDDERITAAAQGIAKMFSPVQHEADAA